MTEAAWISSEQLGNLSTAARQAPRRRTNLNFHASGTAPCQRLLIAVEPDSYIAPHRHLDPAKDETLLVLRGRLGIVLFDEAGQVTGKAVLDPLAEHIGVTVGAGTFHGLLALESGSVFFEAKAGPYEPLSAAERAPWAPAEGDPAASAYLATLRGHFAGR